MFIVVWAALVINTIVQKGPIIFLKLAEATEGQYDGIVYPTKSFEGLDNYENTEGVFINFTQVQSVVGSKYNLVPRKQFCGAKVGSDYGIMQQNYDDEYMENYRAKFINTTDGFTALPS